MRRWNAEWEEYRDLTDKMSAWLVLRILSTIYPKSRFCTKRHKRLYFQGFSGVFKPFARKAEKGNCKFEPRKYNSVFEVWFGTFHTHKPLLRREPFLWLQRRTFWSVINIHPPSGWFFTCGHSPLFFAMRKRIYTNCQLRGDCYLPPVNGPLSLIVNCSPSISSLYWFCMYSAIRLSFFPTVST